MRRHPLENQPSQHKPEVLSPEQTSERIISKVTRGLSDVTTAPRIDDILYDSYEVAVLRNVYVDGKPTGEKEIQDGWREYGRGRRNSDGADMSIVVLLGQANQNIIAAKTYTRKDLEAIQEQYNREFGVIIDEGATDYMFGPDNIRRLKRHAESVANTEGLSDSQVRLATEALSRGTVNSENILIEDVLKDGHDSEAVRHFFADMITDSPEAAETAQVLAKERVVGMHFTRGTALDGVMRHGGLVAARTLREKGEPVATGEHIYQAAGGQPSISFSNLASLRETINAYAGTMGVKNRSYAEVLDKLQDDIKDNQGAIADREGFRLSDTGLDHFEHFTASQINILEQVKKYPESLLTWTYMHDFPVAFGVSMDFVDEKEKHRISGPTYGRGESYFGEFRPATDNISLDDLPVMAVPEELVGTLQNYLNQHGFTKTKVVPFEHFYRVVHKD